MKLIKISVLTTKDDFQFYLFHRLRTEIRNTLVQNSLDKLMQFIAMEPHIYDLDRGEINDLDRFLKNLHRVVLR